MKFNPGDRVIDHSSKLEGTVTGSRVIGKHGLFYKVEIDNYDDIEFHESRLEKVAWAL